MVMRMLIHAMLQERLSTSPVPGIRQRLYPSREGLLLLATGGRKPISTVLRSALVGHRSMRHFGKAHTKRLAFLARDPTTTMERAKKSEIYRCNLIATATLAVDQCCGVVMKMPDVDCPIDRRLQNEPMNIAMNNESSTVLRRATF